MVISENTTDANRAKTRRAGLTTLAWRDLRDALKMSWFWLALGWNDILQRYRGSLLGPFWLTLTSAAFIAGLGPLYARLFNLNMADYLPYLAYGFTVWGFIAGSINESCMTFTSSGDTMKQLSMPRFVPLFQLVWRNVIVFLHNLPIYVVVMVFLGPAPSWALLNIIPGFIIVVLNLIWIGIILAILCLRFRDIPPIIGSIMQISFFLTPVMWHYGGGGSHGVDVRLVELNPFAAFVELIRAPLLGQEVSPALLQLSLICLVVGYALAALVFIRYRRQIIYWL